LVTNIVSPQLCVKVQKKCAHILRYFLAEKRKCLLLWYWLCWRNDW